MSLAQDAWRRLRPPGDAAQAVRGAAVLLPLTLAATALALMALAAVGVAQGFSDTATPPPILDFDVFRISGDLAGHGHLAQAYDWPTLERLEAALGRSRTGYLPFAYPPPFALAMAALSGLPIGAAYAVFTAAGFTLLAGALRRLSAAWFWPSMLALSPALLVNVMGGQNGMLTAGLAGLSAALALGGRGGAAGAAAGLLAALKPQTALGLPLLFALGRNGRALAAMMGAGAALAGLATLLLGPAIWPAFLGGLAETGRALAANRFPLHRMVSVYACLRSFGVPTALALPIHGCVAATVLAAVAAIGRRLPDPRDAAGPALMATAFVSPYFYDYDVTVAGVGLAVALPALARRLPPGAVAALLGAVALGGGAGALQTLCMTTRLSLGAPLLMLCLAGVLVGLRRAPTRR